MLIGIEMNTCITWGKLFWQRYPYIISDEVISKSNQESEITRNES